MKDFGTVLFTPVRPTVGIDSHPISKSTFPLHLCKEWASSLGSSLFEDLRKRSASLMILNTVNNGKIVAIALAPLQDKSLRPMTR